MKQTMRSLLAIAIILAETQSGMAQDYIIERLDASPRHQEWVQIKYGERVVHAFVVYPEVKEKAPAVLVIHENRGLNDWVRGVADQLAEQGYIAIAPDLLSGMGPDGGKTSDFPNTNAARDALYKLDPAQITADLNATFAYVAGLPACNGKVAVAGFCWGGSQTFRYATSQPKLAAAFVFYGRAPADSAQLAKIACPVYGFYGGNDARVTATVPETQRLMKAAGKVYDPVVYEAARHAFMRRGEGPEAEGANKTARDAAWQRWQKLLAKIFH